MNSIVGLDTNSEEFKALKNLVYSGVNIDSILAKLKSTDSADERREIISEIACEALRVKPLNLPESEIKKRFDSIASRIANKHIKERFSGMCNFFYSIFAQEVKKLDDKECQEANAILSECSEFISEIHNEFSKADEV